MRHSTRQFVLTFEKRYTLCSELELFLSSRGNRKLKCVSKKERGAIFLSDIQ